MPSGVQYVTSRYDAPGLAVTAGDIDGAAGLTVSVARACGVCDGGEVTASVELGACVGNSVTFCSTREQAVREMMIKISGRLCRDFMGMVSLWFGMFCEKVEHQARRGYFLRGRVSQEITCTAGPGMSTAFDRVRFDGSIVRAVDEGIVRDISANVALGCWRASVALCPERHGKRNRLVDALMCIQLCLGHAAIIEHVLVNSTMKRDN
jgi:hypothetical protein